MYDQKLGDRIKTLREGRGLSLQKVADFVGTSKNSVYKWETGQANPHAKNLAKLADCFGLDPVFLAYGVMEEQTAHDELVKRIGLLNESAAALILSLVEKMLSPRTELEIKAK